MNPNSFPFIDPELFDRSLWTDRVTVDGVFSGGFVITPFAYVCDKAFPEPAYKLYSFFLGLAARGDDAAPTVPIQRKIMGWGKEKYYTARDYLVERGLLSVHRGGRVNGQWTQNTYSVHLIPLTPDQIEAEKAAESEKFHSCQDTAAMQADIDFDGLPESFKLNLAQNRVFHNPQVKPCPGNPDTVNETSGVALPHDSGKLTKPQVKPCPGHPDTVHPDTIIGSNSIHTCNSIQPDPRESSRIETAPETQSVPARSDGRTDGAYGTSAEDNHAPFPATATDEEAEQGWTELSRSSVNRNLIRDGKQPYLALLALGYSVAEIQYAWDRRQDAAKRAGRGPRYYPQLKKWLESDGDDGARSMIERSRNGDGRAGRTGANTGAHRSLSSLASRDEAFGRIYWAYCDARQRANQAGVDPERDAECVRLRETMDAEAAAARKRLTLQIE